MHLRPAIAAIFAFGFALAASPVSASPGYNFVCYDGEHSATIGLDEGWETAYMENNWGKFELKAAEGQGGPDPTFDFSDSTYRFRGLAPEGQIERGDTVVARCWQTAESIKAIALYDRDTGGRWSPYDAEGKGFQTVRNRPSVFGDKLASLEQGTPVTILENTDQFLDGFYWFKIRYGEGLFGYIWGALLCTDAENQELNATLRRCQRY